jgi:hypothetical protein
MAYSENIEQYSTMKAGADLSAAANQFRALKLDSTAGQVVVATAGTDICVGILDNRPASGQYALITALKPGSIVKVKIGASQTIAVGDKIVPGTGGDFVEGTTNDLCSLLALEALTTAGGASGIISCLVISTIKL